MNYPAITSIAYSATLFEVKNESIISFLNNKLGCTQTTTMLNGCSKILPIGKYWFADYNMIRVITYTMKESSNHYVYDSYVEETDYMININKGTLGDEHYLTIRVDIKTELRDLKITESLK